MTHLVTDLWNAQLASKSLPIKKLIPNFDSIVSTSWDFIFRDSKEREPNRRSYNFYHVISWRLQSYMKSASRTLELFFISDSECYIHWSLRLAFFFPSFSIFFLIFINFLFTFPSSRRISSLVSPSWLLSGVYRCNVTLLASAREPTTCQDAWRYRFLIPCNIRYCSVRETLQV